LPSSKIAPQAIPWYDLANEWATMNRETKGATAPMPVPMTTAPKPASVSPSSASTMSSLANEWAAMNREQSDQKTTPASLPSLEVSRSRTSLGLSNQELYQRRGARVKKEGSLYGKARWGASEINRLATGDVKEPGRLEAEAPLYFVPANDGLYQQRNERVQAAAAAGSGRWGPLEVNRVSESPSSPVLPALKIRAFGGAMV
jgi:hypothetical protein